MERVVENKLIRDPYPNRTLFSKEEHSLLPRPFSYAHARGGKDGSGHGPRLEFEKSVEVGSRLYQSGGIDARSDALLNVWVT